MDEKRIPPHNLDAERAVIGSIILDTTTRSGDRVMDLCLTSGVKVETFFDPRHRAIFNQMLEMNRSAKTLDFLTLLNELEMNGKLEAVGGGPYIQAMVDDVPTTAHAEHYINIIVSKALRRTLIENSTEVITKCYDEGEYPDPAVVLGEAEKSFLEIGSERGNTKSWDAAISDSFKRIDRLFETGGKELEGLSTGLTYLDEKLQGLKPAEMIVIAARPSVGKTSLAMNIAESVALGVDMEGRPIKFDGGKPHPVAIFSLEMPVDALTRRMLAGRAGINTWKLNRSMYLKDERTRLTTNLMKATEELRRAPIYVDDTAALDIMDLRARARRMKKQHGIELIVIDYLQLCCCHEGNARQSRQIEVSIISQQIKAMAKELRIPVIVLSQLSRANEQRGDKEEKPKLSDLRDSGAIEQDADVVFLLRRPSRSEKSKDAQDLTLAIIDVAKNRNGETGEVKVDFIRELTRFRDRPPEAKIPENMQSSEPTPTHSEYTEDPML